MNQSSLDARPQSDDTRLIPLTQGQFAIVDAADYVWLSKFKWQAKWNSKTKSYYAQRTTAQVNYDVHTVMMHREIMGIPLGDKRQIDHIESGNTLDNRRSNLRIATGFQNQHNRRRSKNNTSGYKGVSPQDGKWKAEINSNGKWYYLGFYNTPEEAHAAYAEAAVRLNGEFARIN